MGRVFPFRGDLACENTVGAPRVHTLQLTVTEINYYERSYPRMLLKPDATIGAGIELAAHRPQRYYWREKFTTPTPGEQVLQ